MTNVTTTAGAKPRSRFLVFCVVAFCVALGLAAASAWLALGVPKIVVWTGFTATYLTAALVWIGSSRSRVVISTDSSTVNTTQRTDRQ